MDDNNLEKDPWANIGNMPPGSNQFENGEVSPENLARSEQWESAMSDAPEFNDNLTPETPATIPMGISSETPTEAPLETSAEARDENIADAAAIINYGLNAAAREIGVEAVIQKIKNFVPNNTEDPIKQLFDELGIDTKEEISDTIYESRAIKKEEDIFRNESINAPAKMEQSQNGALDAIQKVKELITEVEDSPDYADLRADALKNGKGIFENAVSKYAVRDLTVLFDALSEQKNHPDANEELLAEEETDEEAKTTNEEIDELGELDQ